LREELTEAHWSFMDRYADVLIARGPTMTEDRTSATGSVHVVDLPGLDAAREFAYEEPNYRAGVYDSVLIRRFRNLTGRTMWQYAGTGQDRFLVLGDGTPVSGAGVIVGGPLLADDGATVVGTAALVETTDRAALTPATVLPWQFGGRPTA
jgi:uncharacterized protein YciI